ncbi:hypothetical protein ACEWY4_021691 [Coilia grayii]|uniref:Protein kinase domain-containing protein n=1 Tax=Coilia grayii TaxID=363190 RepID=A0ABD1J7E9_9TELE
MYCVSELLCEGSEYSFEELRAKRFWAKRKQQELLREMDEEQRKARECEEEVRRIQERPTQTESKPTIQPAVSQALSRPPAQPQEDQQQASAALQPEPAPLTARFGPTLSNRHSLGSRAAPTFRPSLVLQPYLDSLPPSGHLYPLEEGETSRCEVDFHRQPSAAATGPPRTTLPPSVTQTSLETAQTSLQSSGVLPTHSQAAFLQTTLLHHQTSSAAESSGVFPTHSQAAFLQTSLQSSGVLPTHSQAAFLQTSLQSSGVLPTHSQAAAGASEPTRGALTSLAGQGNHSHVTPNTSLGLIQATPSRVLPSPTIHTREALDLIMDMFQAPTFAPNGLSQIAEESLNVAPPKINKPAEAQPAAAAFTIFQDEDNKENGGRVTAANGRKALQAREETPAPGVSQQNETAFGMESMTDETAMWSSRHHTLAPCPNSTRDFAPLAHLMSTPFHLNAPHSWKQESDQVAENDGPTVSSAPNENHPFLRQPTKLSPIIEQSPVDDNLLPALALGVVGAQGTIVGEALAAIQQSQSQTASVSYTTTQPLAALSFPDHTAAPTEDNGAFKLSSSSTAPKFSWTVYQSPEKLSSTLEAPRSQLEREEMEADMPMALDNVPAARSFLSRSSLHAAQTEDLFAGSQDLFQRSHCDIPMSPEAAPTSRPVVDDVSMSPAPPASRPTLDIPMSPDPAPVFNLFKVSSPVAELDLDFGSVRARRSLSSASVAPPRQEPSMMESPAKRPEVGMDVPMSPLPTSALKSTPAAPAHLVSDPWDDELIRSLLSRLKVPLSSHPNVTTWDCNLPNISPKLTTTMAGESLRVDFVLGQGAFATVYQATNLTTSEKFFLKVQKPANPWEYYINSQLNTRLQPNVRHLYNNIHSAHFFRNGSILLGDLHNCGTLLNAVNLYKSRSEKVMPQALVLYFTSCILHMVDQLHSAHIVHADIKPDNFLLGEKFLENECFDAENVEHGLALIDLGQSIDMSLFPEGTAFTAKCMTSAFQCTEMLSGRPWNYQTDYFGIAGTVYCMIFGSYMQVKHEDDEWRPSGTFKRNPHSELWQEFFRVLLNVPDCSSPPCLRRLRSRVHTELQEHYGAKIRGLKNRLVVQLLESRPMRR